LELQNILNIFRVPRVRLIQYRHTRINTLRIQSHFRYSSAFGHVLKACEVDTSATLVKRSRAIRKSKPKSLESRGKRQGPIGKRTHQPATCPFGPSHQTLCRISGLPAAVVARMSSAPSLRRTFKNGESPSFRPTELFHSNRQGS
jgi:hypothetical protein